MTTETLPNPHPQASAPRSADPAGVFLTPRVLDQRAFRDGAEEAQVEIDKRERRRREVAAAQAEANERHRERRGR